MRTYLAPLLLALGLAGTAMADSTPVATTSTTTATAPAPAPAPNAKKWLEVTGMPLQLGPITAAEQMGDALQQATLSPKTKQAAKQRLDDLKAQADIKLAPVVDVLERAHAAKKRNESEQADVVRRMDELEAARPGANATQGDVDAFNVRVDLINKELDTVHEKIARDNEKYTKEFGEVSTQFDAWLNEGANGYITTGQKLLSGEIKEGEAMRQLRKAAAGYVPEVMDGGGTTVDATDVEKWTPEQRRKEQEKPRVQLPKNFKKTPPPPPPPTPSAAPSTSSDTAKSKPAKPSR